jgi:hypothetical protein
MRALTAAVLFSTLALSAAPARAADAPPATPLVNLQWDAPAGCPDEAAMRAKVQRNLPAGMTPSVPLGAHGTVTSTSTAPPKWRATLALRTPDGADERVLEGETCEAVSEAAALVISMALGAAASAPPPPPPPPPRAPVLAPFLSVAGVGDVGTLPRAEGGLAVSLGAIRGRWRLGLEALGLRGQSATVAGTSEVGARVAFVSASARACRAVVDGPWTLAPCVDAGLSRTRAAGFGPISPGDAENTTVSLGAGLLAAWAPLRHVAPFLFVGGEIPVQRPRFSVENLGQVHRSAPVWGRAALGLELRFR